MRPLVLNHEVNYVAAPATESGKTTIKKGKIIEVINPGAVRLELSESEYAIAEYSADGLAGTFHFIDEAKDVKKAETFGAKPEAASAQKKE